MSNPFLEGAGATQTTGTSNPFLPTTTKKKASSNPFLPSAKGDDLEEETTQLETLAETTGAPSIPQESPGLFRRVVDVISRPNYAVAGAVQEAFSGRPENILPRIGSELASGIGSIKGQKKGFAQVMEELGVGELGSLSDIAPFLYSETGEGLPLKKGGGLDITGRGVLGFAGDVFLDPTTYLTIGAAKGVQIGGKALPGSAKALTSMGQAIRSTVKTIPMFDEAINAFGGVFKRDWKIRNLPGAVRLKQAHLNRQALAKAELYEELSRSKIAAIPKSRRAEFVDAMDDGTWITKYANEPDMLQAGREVEALNKRWATDEVANGLLEGERIRPNYIAHFYENSPEELNRAQALWPGPKLDKGDIGRHAEIRAFNTLKEAEEWSKRAHAVDASVPILKPLRDPLEIMRRRGETSIEAIEFKAKYIPAIREAFGRADLPFNAEDFYDLVRAVPTTGTEGEVIASLIAKGKTEASAFRALSESGRKEFMRQRILRSKSPEEVINVLNKYGVENAPKQKRLLSTLAEDGTPYKTVDITGLKGVEIPQSIAQDLAEMSERVLKSRELNHLLRYYDRANNTFKAFVTVMFPAFHFRNAYSNIAQGFADVGMSVLNPARHYDAYAALRGLDGAMTTKLGEAIPYAQLKREMAEQGVTATGRQIAEYTGTQGVERLSTVAGKVKAAPRRVGQAIENEARAALYTVHRHRGLSAVEAGERVKQTLFDYSNLSRVEQDFFRRMIPFYTWTRKNLEQQFRNLATKPGLTAAEIKPFRGREDENGMMTSWEAEALKVRLNRDGKTLRVLTGVDLPIRGLDFIWNGNVRGTLRQAMGMLSPILKAPVEVAGGTSFFTGKEMTRQQSALVGRAVEFLDPPKPVQDWLGYKKETDAAGRPKYTFDGERFYILFQSWALSRLVSTSDRQFQTFADKPDVARVLLDVMTGLRNKELNLDAEQEKRLKERIRQLRQSLVRRGALKEGSYTYKPKGP
jgi:hypothetical protein